VATCSSSRAHMVAYRQVWKAGAWRAAETEALRRARAGRRGIRSRANGAVQAAR